MSSAFQSAKGAQAHPPQLQPTGPPLICTGLLLPGSLLPPQSQVEGALCLG